MVKSVVRETVNKLKLDGHELIEMNTSFFPDAVDFMAKLVFGVDPSLVVDNLQGEPPAFAYEPQYTESECSVTSLFSPLILSLSGYKQFSHCLNVPKITSIKELCALTEQICLFKSEFNDYWTSMDFDCVICPP